MGYVDEVKVRGLGRGEGCALPVWVALGGVGMDVDLFDEESAVGREEKLVLGLRRRRILGTDEVDVFARHLWEWGGMVMGCKLGRFRDEYC